jgi:glycerol-3-phosphate dehydrogenase
MAARFSILGVVGAGQMGSGIAQVAAAASMDVILSDVNQKALDRGMEAINASLARFVKKGTLGQVSARRKVFVESSLLELFASLIRVWISRRLLGMKESFQNLWLNLLSLCFERERTSLNIFSLEVNR